MRTQILIQFIAAAAALVVLLDRFPVGGLLLIELARVFAAMQQK